ncbi:MAG: EamA family transporter [Sphingobacteriales bacterium]|nr:MAG: EamA family transporter [Sphingobacteriales bacterium]
MEPLYLREHGRGIAAVVIASVVWSTGGLFVKLLPFNAMTILFYRSLFAGILFAAVYRREVLLVNKTAFIASGFYALLLICFVSATKLTTAANAIFLQYTAPVYVLLLEPRLFGLKLQKINVITIIACVAGMGLFFSDNLEGGGGWGNLIALLSGVFLAGLLLSQRMNDHRYYISAVFWGNVWIVLICFPFFAMSATPSTEQFGMLMFLGFVQIGVGYLLFTYGLKRTLAIESALLAMIEPVLNPVWVWIGHGEKPSLQALLGGAIIIIALSVRILVLELAKNSKKEIKSIN